MTGSTSRAIDEAVMVWNAGHRDAALALVRKDGLIESLRAEIERIDTPGLRNLLDPRRPDVVSQRLHKALREILDAVASVPLT